MAETPGIPASSRERKSVIGRLLSLVPLCSASRSICIALTYLLAVIALILIAATPPKPPYDRRAWPHWSDEDQDCLDTRNEVLLRDSVSGVGFADDRGCLVSEGEWEDPYTGKILTMLRNVQVDHLVPLKNAHDSGGFAWSRQRRIEYANDLGFRFHLLAVSGTENRKKGARGPDEWKPPNKAFWCQYAQAWATIKQVWNLRSTAAEREALRDMLVTC